MHTQTAPDICDPSAPAAAGTTATPALLAAGVAVLRIGRAVLLSALVGMAFFAIAPAAIGWQPTVVVSGSMVPAIHVGDVVVTSPLHAKDAATLPIGSVVLAADPTRPGGALMHRVVGRHPDGTLVTKGDANLLEDSTPMPPENLRGLARVKVPAIGVPLLRLRGGDPMPAIALVIMTITVVAVAPRRRRRAASGAETAKPT